MNDYKEKISNYTDPFKFLRSLAVLCVFLLHVSLFTYRLGFVYDKYTWPIKTPAWSAVWILFIVSGYFIGKGFYQQKYTYNMSGILKFYIRRFIKVGVPTWIFIFISCTVVEPDFLMNNPSTVVKILTFTYYNIPASECIGATWYISTLMQLYLFAPFICWAISIIVKRMQKYTTLKIVFLLIFIIVVGLLFRRYLYLLGVDWSSKVYVPFYSNLDLYISGILLNYINIPLILSDCKKKILNVCIKIGLLGLILVNCYIAYMADFNLDYLYCYQYILPSVYIIFVAVYLKIAELTLLPQKPLSLPNLFKNPLRIFELFAKISFEFYLVHSMIISKIYIYIKSENTFYLHLKVLLSSFIISVIFSFLLRNMFSFIKER